LKKPEADGALWLRQLQIIPAQEEVRDKSMFKSVIFLWLICIFIFVFSSGCAKSRMGKVDLSGEATPNFLKAGTTTTHEVLEQIGEPFGYREKGDRSAMIYISFQDDYINLLFSQFRMEKAYRLDLIFQNDVLQKAEIKKEGWGFGANIDPQLIQLLAR
jgi:hypothetical protein